MNGAKMAAKARKYAVHRHERSKSDDRRQNVQNPKMHKNAILKPLVGMPSPLAAGIGSLVRENMPFAAGGPTHIGGICPDEALQSSAITTKGSGFSA